MDDDYISASEINEYLYCRRAWWYRRRGTHNTNQPVMDIGTVQDVKLATAVEQVERSHRLAWRLLLVGLLILIALLVLRGLLGMI